MEIRDPVHGSIQLTKEEEVIINHPFFQRLRNIKQLGFSEFVFPGATHTRYLHSIGVMDVADKVFTRLFHKQEKTKDILRLKESLRLACLLHDIGHAPLSHTTEFVMPSLKSLNLPKRFLSGDLDRQANHEDYTIKSIVESSFTEAFKPTQEKYGIHPDNIAELITGKTQDEAYFTVNGINYFPLLHSLVSSEMDCDRMDYLLRDSYFCGVSYGKYDLDWVIDNLTSCEIDGHAYLALDERAVSTFDDFLLSRFHMFLMVYFHYKCVCLEKLLERYFNSPHNEYIIPSNIEEYLHHDDHYLLKVLRNSENIYAQKIINNVIPQKILETFGVSQDQTLKTLKSFLESNNIDYIECSSSGRLSKYYKSDGTESADIPMKVIRKSPITNKISHILSIDEASDLFQKFSEAHKVTRIHCEFETLNQDLKNQIEKIIHN